VVVEYYLLVFFEQVVGELVLFEASFFEVVVVVEPF
jgi:hypothetical protein